MDKNLLPGWEAFQTDEGEWYYYHEGREETTWDKPEAPKAAPKPAPRAAAPKAAAVRSAAPAAAARPKMPAGGGIRRGLSTCRLGRGLRGLGLVPRRLLAALVVVVPLALVGLEGLPAGEEVLVHRVGVLVWMSLGEASFCLVQLRYSKEMQRATRWLRQNNFRLSCTATALRATSSRSQCLGSQAFCCEGDAPRGTRVLP